jgi:hypothetical protein
MNMSTAAEMPRGVCGKTVVKPMLNSRKHSGGKGSVPLPPL